MRMDDLISREAALEALRKCQTYLFDERDPDKKIELRSAEWAIEDLPSAQPEIIRCKDCKHWTQSVGKMKDYGLGRCDFHDADLVAYNGFCYWAERRTDEID